MSDQVNFPGYVVVMWIILMFAIYYVFREFADRAKFRWHNYVTISVSYFTAGGVMMLVPIDIALTIVGRRSHQDEQTYDDSSSVLVGMYTALYVPMLLLTSLFQIFQEEYNKNGYFTESSRVLNSIKDGMYVTICAEPIISRCLLVHSRTILFFQRSCEIGTL